MSRIGKILLSASLGWVLGVALMTINTVQSVPLANAAITTPQRQVQAATPAAPILTYSYSVNNLPAVPSADTMAVAGKAATAVLAAYYAIHRPIPRWHAFLYALRQRGKWYCWGGTGPSCFDCSGLIYAAYQSIGWRYFGRDTYDMLGYGLASGRLRIIPLRDERAGDLLFYGTGHVGMATGHWGWTLEALNPSLPIGFYSWQWYGYPTMAVHVVGAG